MALIFVADRGDARLRLDRVVVRRLASVPRISRARVQRWIDNREVLVNGRPATRAAASVSAGDRIEITAAEALVPRAVPEPETWPIDLLYEDADLIVLNKPPGRVVHPTYKHASGTMLNALLGHIGTRDIGTPRLVHRLDKDTSGVLLVSLDQAVHVALQRTLASDASCKEYLAVAHGRLRPATGRIRLALGRDPADRRRVVVRPDGRESETRYQVLSRSEALSLVRCELVTGRTHQVRVHLAARGCPIVGDTVYGTASELIPRQALHAWRLTFVHPVTRKTLTATAPLPEDFARLISRSDLADPSSAVPWSPSPTR